MDDDRGWLPGTGLASSNPVLKGLCYTPGRYSFP
jgi:hypothetical protein